MSIHTKCSKAVAVAVSVALLVCVSVHTTQAAMIATQQVVDFGSSAFASPGDRERVREFLDRGDVQAVLVDWGVDATEAKARVDAMTDAELASVAGRLDAMPAGGSAVGAIVGAIVLIFLVLLLTDILGLTDIFPFVKKKR
jgi:hypothetical protein